MEDLSLRLCSFQTVTGIVAHLLLRKEAATPTFSRALGDCEFSSLQMSWDTAVELRAFRKQH
jgi:hypothetical protein